MNNLAVMYVILKYVPKPKFDIQTRISVGSVFWEVPLDSLAMGRIPHVFSTLGEISRSSRTLFPIPGYPLFQAQTSKVPERVAHNPPRGFPKKFASQRGS